MKDTSIVLMKNYFQVQTWHPARTHFHPSPILLCRDSQPAALASITGGLDRTGPPWLPRLQCYCGRMNGAGIEIKTRGEEYQIPPSDIQQSRAMSIPGSSRQSQSTGRQRKPFESREGQYSSSNKCDYKSFLSLTYSHTLQCFSNSTVLTIAY